MGDTDKREHPRMTLPGVLRGSANFRHDVQILDLSQGGARIEHAERLPPGMTFVLGLNLQGVDVRLGAQIVWSHVTRIHSGANGEGGLRFRSGMRFLHIPKAAEAHLRDFLATLAPPDADPTEADPTQEPEDAPPPETISALPA